jgi:hypothetical protein
MKENIRFWLKSLLTSVIWTALLITVAYGAYAIYEGYKENKELELSRVKISSNKLEDAKFVDIRLGKSIDSYKGFRLLDPYSGDNFYEESIGEQAYGYFNRDGKYSNIGSFSLSDPIAEAAYAGIELSRKQITNSSDVRLSVYTFNNKIYKISFVVKEFTDSNFNDILKAAYGPSSADNGHNDVRYYSDEQIIWESPNVLLTTHGETKAGYYKGRLSMIPDKKRYVTYLYKPLKLMLDSAQSAKNNKTVEDAVNKL